MNLDLITELQDVSLTTLTVIALVVLVALLVLYDVVFGVRSHRKFLAAMRAAPAAEEEAVRTRFLLQWAWQPWVLTIAALLLVAVSPGLDFAAVGLRLPTIPSFDEPGGSALFGAAVGIALVAIVLVIVTVRNRRKPDQPAAIPGPYVNANLDPMLPTGRTDRRAWILVSTTAGITEEFMYRGVLLLALAVLLPDAHPFVIAVIAVLLFGAAHTYQGWAGFILTGIVAVPFTMLYVITGSLLPGMVLHFAMDARAAYVKRQAAAPAAVDLQQR